MIVLGLVLLVIGWLTGISLLITLGVLLLVAGAVLYQAMRRWRRPTLAGVAITAAAQPRDRRPGILPRMPAPGRARQ